MKDDDTTQNKNNSTDDGNNHNPLLLTDDDQNYQVVWNATTLMGEENLPVSVMIVWEPSYRGGAGIEHGSIEDLLLQNNNDNEKIINQKRHRGRLLIVVGDDYAESMQSTIEYLDAPPQVVSLNLGLLAEVASVQSRLYKSAGKLLDKISPALEEYCCCGNSNKNSNNSSATTTDADDDDDDGPAIHFVGRSMGGAIAALAAVILDGSLPLPTTTTTSRSRNKKKKSKKKKKSTTKKKSKPKNIDSAGQREPASAKENGQTKGGEESSSSSEAFSLCGIGKGRTSAMVLGSPPCLSRNVGAAYVTSVIYGDDVICRTTKATIDHLCERTAKAVNNKGGMWGRRVGWMSETVSLTMSSLMSHAHGSEGEEGRLAVPGNSYLVRPRRLGGASSMHEVGSLKGGREALRAAVLWQLNDVLLSRSMWSHHSLEAYIEGLDRVQLRGFEEDEDQSH